MRASDLTLRFSKAIRQNQNTQSKIMAASEPPEPPKRNPDKINAPLKQMTSSDSKTYKSLDTSDRPINIQKQPILSAENSTIEVTNSTLYLPNNSLTVNSVVGNTKNLMKSNNISGNCTMSTSSVGSMVVKNQNSTSTISPLVDSISEIELSSTEYLNGDDDHGCKTCFHDHGNSNSCTNRNVGSGYSSGSPSENVNNVILSDEAVTSKRTFTKVNNNDNNNKQIDTNNANDILFDNFLIGTNNQELDGCLLNEAFYKKDDDSILKIENDRLTKEVFRLKRLFEYSEARGAVGGIDILSGSNSIEVQSADDTSSRIDRLEAELKFAKQQITHLKGERKKIKADKMDLLVHIKQLYTSLHDKEKELRDFIRNFEHRIRETETSNAKLSSEQEREKWALLKRASDESERSLALAAQLNAREVQLQRIQEQLHETRRQLSGCMSDQESLHSFAPLTPPSGLMTHLTGTAASSGFVSMSGVTSDRGSCSVEFGIRSTNDGESAAADLNLSDINCVTVDQDSISLVSSHHDMYQYGTPKEPSPTLSPLNSGSFSRLDVGATSRSVEQLNSPGDSDCPPQVTRRTLLKTNTGTLGTRSGRGSNGGGGTWGSISRVFIRTRYRNKSSQPADADGFDFQWSPLTEEGYAEKLRLLREASVIPIERWRASQVLAWLEVALGMPQYSSRCAENVKSGKVLLELNDGELEAGLGLSHPMHRKKLRLAIEEQRRPDLVRYSTIGHLGHTWVASEWLPDIGLPQYTESFMHSLVDARMLDTLSKKELEKFLNVTRKFHQASLVHGIHVLRILKYDRQALSKRRLQCENVDADPIVWTNQRFIRWTRSIDLSEYADNLKDSGVHGGLVVLEPSFSGDTIATALGIPLSKNIIRRHLSTEFEALILPARAQLGQGIRTGGGSVVPITGPGGLQQQHNYQQYHHHYNSNDRRSSGSLRGSLSKAFRLNTTKNRTNNNRPLCGGGGNSTSPTPSYSSSSENGIYATIGQPPQLFSLIAPQPPPQTTLPSSLILKTESAPEWSSSPPGNDSLPPPSHRVSAPPMDTHSSLTRHAQHRRVKSISDIEIIATAHV